MEMFTVSAETLINGGWEQSVINLVSEYGIACFPRFVDEGKLDQLNGLFDQIIDGNVVDDSLHVLDNSTVDVTIFNTLIGTDNLYLNEVKSFFQQDDFRKISDAYFNKVPYNLSRDIFIARDRPGAKHEALDLHFDVRPTFKFFLYLNDVKKENGAFTVVPKSHKQTKLIRKKYGSQITYENRGLSRPDDVAENELVPIELPAGSLIVFTTEVFHRAGVVTSGERRVMRGHCWPKEKADGSSLVNKVSKKIRSIFK